MGVCSHHKSRYLMTTKKRIAFLFPGQGAQYVGMGKDFYSNFPSAKHIFEQADDILQRSLSRMTFSGAESELTATRNSQPAIFTTSLAILQVIKELFPHIEASFCAGLSLGEYSALAAGNFVSFAEALRLVQCRGEFMHQACEEIPGTMAVIIGMQDEAVCALVNELNAPQDIWAANFNCPGQVVISGTKHGIELATGAALKQGARKVMPLQVHGAFHSGLMKPAQEKLTEHIRRAAFTKGTSRLAMNCTGNFAVTVEEIKHNLIQQVISPVYWHKSVQLVDHTGVDLFIEIGCGKTLAGMNKRIGVQAATLSIEKIEDLPLLEKV